MALTQLRERFVEEYLSQPSSAASAYRRASGKQTKSANVEACKLLKHPRIKEAIARRQKQLQKEYSYTRDKAYQELRSVIDNLESPSADKLKAIDMLCKLFGLYSSATLSSEKQPRKSQAKQVLSPTRTTRRQGLEAMSDEQLRNLL